jgi:hypothetical protein
MKDGTDLKSSQPLTVQTVAAERPPEQSAGGRWEWSGVVSHLLSFAPWSVWAGGGSTVGFDMTAEGELWRRS